MTDSVAASLAASTIEDGAATIEVGAATVVPGDDDGAAAAAKKAAANKKKRERQKAKKKADGEERDGTSFLRDVVPDLGATVLKEERRDAGPNRGQGMFATAAAEQKAVLAEAVPALTVVFDGATSEVCGFCFGPVDPSPPTRPVELTLRAAAGGGFGVMIDESPLPKNVDEGAASRACVTAVLEDSANYAAGGGGEESLKLGDRLVSVEGTPVVGGRDAAAKMLQEAVRRAQYFGAQFGAQYFGAQFGAQFWRDSAAQTAPTSGGTSPLLARGRWWRRAAATPRRPRWACASSSSARTAARAPGARSSPCAPRARRWGGGCGECSLPLLPTPASTAHLHLHHVLHASAGTSGSASPSANFPPMRSAAPTRRSCACCSAGARRRRAASSAARRSRWASSAPSSRIRRRCPRSSWPPCPTSPASPPTSPHLSSI